MYKEPIYEGELYLQKPYLWQIALCTKSLFPALPAPNGELQPLSPGGGGGAPRQPEAKPQFGILLTTRPTTTLRRLNSLAHFILGKCLGSLDILHFLIPNTVSIVHSAISNEE